MFTPPKMQYTVESRILASTLTSDDDDDCNCAETIPESDRCEDNSVIKDDIYALAKTGNLSRLRELYASGSVDFFAPNESSRSVLYCACLRGHIPVVNFLIKEVGMVPDSLCYMSALDKSVIRAMDNARRLLK